MRSASFAQCSLGKVLIKVQVPDSTLLKRRAEQSPGELSGSGGVYYRLVTFRPANSSENVRAYRFGPFEVDLRKAELRKFGTRIRLERKPWYLLLALLEHPGELVSRSELEASLWEEGVFVDFEHGLNVAVKKVRTALGDSGENPRYVETVSREGYRFIARVERVSAPSSDGSQEIQSLPGVLKPEDSRMPAPAIAVAERRLPYLKGVAASLVLLAMAGWWVLWGSLYPTSPPTPANGWVLITDFDNRSGDHRFDGALEYALDVELGNSRFVKVVPRERVEDVLRLMRKPADSRIDGALGREICLRDGEIHAFIKGRIEKLGKSYVLGIEVLNPAKGTRVAGLIQEEVAETKVGAAVRRIANRVRAIVGEDPRLIPLGGTRLEPVTTPSLRSLQLYSQANRVIGRSRDGDRQAIELLEQALKDDSNFASAHLLLGYAYNNLVHKDRAIAHLQRAFALSEATTDPERLFIRGCYYLLAAKEPEKAVAAFEALVRLYPEHYWGNINLANAYLRLGRRHSASEHWAHLADLRPNDLHASVEAARWLTLEAEEIRRRGAPTDSLTPEPLRRAQSYAARGLKLLQLEGDGAETRDADTLRLWVVRQYWVAGNMTEAYNNLLAAERQNSPASNESLGDFFMAFGRTHEAEKHLADNGTSAAAVAYCQGDLSRTRLLLDAGHISDPIVFDVAASLMTRVGMLREAERLHRRMETALEHPTPPGPRLLTVEGQLELARGNTARGIVLLEQALPQYEGATAAWLGYEALAAAYRKEGRLTDAARMLERTPDIPVNWNGSPAFLLRVRLQLADILRELGRVDKAKRVEAELRKRLMFADADHPIVKALARR
jgi:DNA-binding winged helix-turn-helix (wHTH) protein/tetratricopeptide (TPR) repeat protein